jgi:hypothetical protein
MENRIEETFRADEYIATGDRAAIIDRPPMETPAGSPANPTNSAIDMPVESGAAALFGASEAAKLRARWHDIQVAFVDEPRESVQQADELVESVARRLTEMFADHRIRLEHEWGKGENSTEELRNAFRRYRTLFDRLLSI